MINTEETNSTSSSILNQDKEGGKSYRDFYMQSKLLKLQDLVKYPKVLIL